MWHVKGDMKINLVKNNFHWIQQVHKLFRKLTVSDIAYEKNIS